VNRIVRRYGALFGQRYPQTAPGVTRTLRLLAACRTPALGGHITRCNHCHDVTYHYHSCGDRHCPQCGGTKRALWLAQRQAELLPVPYFHVVFTLPHQLSALALGNRRILYQLLFDAAAQTLLEVAADPKHLGAQVGVLAVFHTWGQQLEHHPHVHCVVPGGGLSPDGGRWVGCRPNFFLPVKVLSRVFRGKYLAGLRQARGRGALQFAGSTAALAEPAAWQTFVDTLYGLDWVVYAKEPFGGPAQVLKYLTQYTHRVALSNRRLVRLTDDQVTFTYKDYADGCARKEMTLAAIEFVRRFALHIVPGRWVRIRHYGLLAHRDRHQRLAHCRALLATDAPPAPLPEPTSEPPALPTAERWRVPLLLTALVLVLPEVTALPPAQAAAGVAALVTPWATPDWFCPRCGRGERVTLWRAERPSAPELAQGTVFDSS
jgi:hypothetical protein